MTPKHTPYDQRFGPWQDHVTYSTEADNSLDRRIAQARAEMGAERWNQLQAEWGQP